MLGRIFQFFVCAVIAAAAWGGITWLMWRDWHFWRCPPFRKVSE